MGALARRGLNPWQMLAVAAATTLSVALAACGSTVTPAKKPVPVAFPTHSITLIIPYANGSAPDISAREEIDLASKYLHQSIVIENNDAGGSMVGLNEVQTAAPNGYTIGYISEGVVDVVPHIVHTAFQGPQDLTPIAGTDIAPFEIFVRASSNITTLSDLIAKAKASPGKITVGVVNPHAIIAFDLAQLGKAAGVTFAPVATATGAQVLGVVNGTTIAGIAQPGIVTPYVKANKLRVLAVFGHRSVPGSSAPTTAALGYHLPPTATQEFFFAPPHTPRAVVDVIANALKRAVASEAFRAYVAKAGIIASYVPPTVLGSQLRTEYPEFGRLMTALGWLPTA